MPSQKIHAVLRGLDREEIKLRAGTRELCQRNRRTFLKRDAPLANQAIAGSGAHRLPTRQAPRANDIRRQHRTLAASHLRFQLPGPRTAHPGRCGGLFTVRVNSGLESCA